MERSVTDGRKSEICDNGRERALCIQGAVRAVWDQSAGGLQVAREVPGPWTGGPQRAEPSPVASARKDRDGGRGPDRERTQAPSDVRSKEAADHARASSRIGATTRPKHDRRDPQTAWSDRSAPPQTAGLQEPERLAARGGAHQSSVVARLQRLVPAGRWRALRPTDRE